LDHRRRHADGAREVRRRPPDLHGPFGEDGTVQGLLELAASRMSAGSRRVGLAMGQGPSSTVMRDSGSRSRPPRDPARRGGREPVRLSVFVSRRASARRSDFEGRVQRKASRPRRTRLPHDEKVARRGVRRRHRVEVGVLGNRVPSAFASLPGKSRRSARLVRLRVEVRRRRMELLVPTAGLPQERRLLDVTSSGE